MGTLIFVLVVAALYFLPALQAWYHGHRNTPAILVLNILAGWTAIGWIVAMVWAFTDRPRLTRRT
jgi:hypothetical protein